MLKPLLLLCWAAIFVSAGGQDVVIDHTSVPINSAGDSSATNLQSLNSNLPATTANENTHVSSTSTSELSNLHPYTKPATSPSTASTAHTANTTAVTSKPTTKPITTPTTTTTQSTTSTTTPVPTTPAPTTPLPPPSTGIWKVEEDDILCIIVQMAAQFNVSYSVNNMTIHKAMDIPSNGTVTGKCGKTEQNLTLSWEVQDGTEINSLFTLHFLKNETERYYSLHHLEIFLAPEKNQTNETIILVHKASQYDTKLSNSYRCLKEQKLTLTREGKDNNKTIGYLTVSNLQFQAFRSDNTTVFGLAKDCSFDTPDIVPITVGCALAGLVVIVLIAYLVGRRRSQARGYLSM